MNVRISAPLFESRFPVGSSANMRSGPRHERARDRDALLLATGQLVRAVLRAGRPGPRSSTICSNHSGSGFLPASAIGSVMFSSALSVGIRLYAWNTNPMRSRRMSVSCFSLHALISMSPRKIWPLRDPVEPGEAVQQRGLARARRAHDRGELRGAELDADAVERADLGFAGCRRSWRR